MVDRGDCCSRPKLSDMGFHTDDRSVFYRSQWTRIPWFVFVIYRMVLALYVFGFIISDTVLLLVSSLGWRYFLFLTNLTYIVFVLYIGMAAVVAVVDGFVLRNRTNTEGMGIRHKIHWFFFNTTLTMNIMVAIVYWSILYRADRHIYLFRNINVHVLGALLSLGDLFLTAIPVRFLHFVYPFGFCGCYLILTLIYWGAGGNVIYPFLDYSDNPGVAVGLIMGVCVGLVIIHCVVWSLYKLRMWIWKKCGSSEIVEDDTKMEEIL